MRAAIGLALLLAACGSRTVEDDKRDALVGTKAYVQSALDDLHAAAVALQAAAPADGWDASRDRAAIDAMKAQWKRARVAYEHVEGAIAILFPELDVSTDERYDGFLADHGPDKDLFDDQGVTGVHAIERILWSDAAPARVVAFEKGLPGYEPARFPRDAAEAGRFKSKLCQRLVDDVKTMRDQFRPLALDPAAAYRGIVGSMREQVEKADKAATGEEESRYAQFTLADMRANVEAGIATYEAFRPWVLRAAGGRLDGQIRAGFQALLARYQSLGGDALPPVPLTWSSTDPSEADLATPFGQLWRELMLQGDETLPGSLVHAMNEAAELLGIPQAH